MKNIISVLFFSFILSGMFFSCKTNTFGEDLKAEKILIDDFIGRQNIDVKGSFSEVDTLKPYPSSDNGSGQKTVYVKTSDGFYFRLDKVGDTSYSVKTGDVISIKYKEYTLGANADTINYWDVLESPYLNEFTYYKGSSSPSLAFQRAVEYMKHSGAEAKLIVPYKLGLYSTDQNVVPYGYDIKILFRKSTDE